MIDQKKFEEMLNRYADGTLATELAAEVEAFVVAHPELLEVPELHVTAPKVTMPGKESLKRKAAVAPLWRYAAAACVAALLLFGALLWSRRPVSQKPMMAEAVAGAVSPEPVVAPAPAVEPAAATAAPRPAIAIVNDPAVAQQPLMAAATNLPAPQALAAQAKPAMPRIVDADGLIAYLPDTVEVDFLVEHVSPLDGQPEWLEPITTPLYNRYEEKRSRIEDAMLAVADKATQPFASILKK